MSKFKVGDKVKLVNYVHPIHSFNEPDEMLKGMKIIFDDGKGHRVVDLSPERLGSEDIITEVINSQGKDSYSLSKSAWYNENQLELAL